MPEMKPCGTVVPHSPHPWPLVGGAWHVYDCPGIEPEPIDPEEKP